MFDIGFSEVLLIFVIALIVLGPEKLPRAASQVGRWIGRARAMARQFKDQLEEEVNLENVRKAHKEAAAKEEAASKEAASGAAGAGAGGSADAAGAGSGAQSTGGAESQPGAQSAGGAESAPGAGSTPGAQSNTQSPASSAQAPYSGPDPVDFRADTFSHAHPTNEYGANPLTANGAAPEESVLSATETSASPTSRSNSEAGASARPSDRATSPSEPAADQAGSSADSTEAYASITPLPAREPIREPAVPTPAQTDNHGHS
jgi:sec-independent protein translocase protein TatB